MIPFEKMSFRPARDAFEDAISQGRLTAQREWGKHYVEDYMYMGTAEGVDLFKHIMTRQYLPTCY